MDISNWTAHRAAWAPGKAAILHEGGAWTYADLERHVGALAGALADGLGVKPGDRVAHLGLNSPELIALVFAAARIGAIVVPLNWRLTPSEHAFQIGDAAPAAILVEPDYWAHYDRIRDQFPAIKTVAYAAASAPSGWRDYDALVAEARPRSPDPARPLKTPVKIVYTSGTTGRPKGAVLSQDTLFHNALHAAEAFGMTERDHVLTALPLFHVGGMNIQTLPMLYWGGTVTLHRRVEPGAILADIARARPTLLLAVPAVSLALIGHPDWAKTDLSSLRCVCGGSSTIPEAAIRPWLDRGIPFTQLYGLTESGPSVIALSIVDSARKIGSTGRPLMHAEVRLVDSDGDDVAPGEKGEIWLRGANVLLEYWRNPEATREAITPEGWFKTGDIAHVDAEGFFYVDDRKKDMIITGGENVYPAELENVLADCADIAEFAVVGRPDPRWGEAPVACIVAKPGRALTKDAVMALFQGRLARYKHPRDVVFLKGPLPRTSLGKVQKFELRRLLAEGAKGDAP
jgi:fatty-acyl-CoA synthase